MFAHGARPAPAVIPVLPRQRARAGPHPVVQPQVCRQPYPASGLAQAVIETRSHKDSRGLPEGFEANEDLLRVAGVDYDLYANIRALITTDQPASGKVNV